MCAKDKMKKSKLYMPHQEIADFCRTNRIRRLALFGSVLREDFSPSSDVTPGFPGFFSICAVAA
jgi:predicted nucleotidyltransferase